MIFAMGLSIAAAFAFVGADGAAPSQACGTVRVIDGDTFDCGAVRIRLQGIDAPEVPGHCRVGRVCAPGDHSASTAQLRRLLGNGGVSCRAVGHDRYRRTIGLCEAGGVDVSCAMLAGGFAIARYARLRCD